MRMFKKVFAVECNPDRLACGRRRHECCGCGKRHPKFRIGRLWLAASGRHRFPPLSRQGRADHIRSCLSPGAG
jgi:hypothetical protein